MEHDPTILDGDRQPPDTFLQMLTDDEFALFKASVLANLSGEKHSRFQGAIEAEQQRRDARRAFDQE